MKLSNLSVGQRIPNYKKLCELLEEPVKDGNSKKSQQREWKRYFSYDREGNAYVIKEIFDTAKLSEDGRASYMRYLEPLLFHYLDESGGSAEHSFKDWSTELGMTSSRVYDEDELAVWMAPNQFAPYIVHRTVNEVATKTKEVLLSTVHALKKRGQVDFKINTYIVQNGGHRLASAEEETAIEGVKRLVREELGVTSMFSVNVNFRNKKAFYERVNEIYQERHGWSSAYTLLRVTATDAAPLHLYEDINVDELASNLQDEIQSAIRIKLNNNEKSSAEKNEEAWEQYQAENDGQKPQFFLSEMDVHAMEFLLEELM